MKTEALVSTSAAAKGSRADASFLCRFPCMPSLKKSETPMPSGTRLAFPSPSTGTKDGVLERIFHYIDKDGDGKISPTELHSCMRTAGDQELSINDMEAVIESMDSDGDGLLGFDDFAKLVEEEGEEEKERNLREAFQVYEMEGQGCITPKSLRRALELLGESKSIEECKTMVRRFDLNGDGVINFEEFCVMIL